MKKQYYVSFFACTLFLISFWGYYLCTNIPIMYELADEYEYVWNAGYLSGERLLDVYPAYYGIGYSLFLIIPLKLCSNGIELIYGCYLVNILFAYGTYWVVCVLLQKWTDKTDWKIPVISMISCLSPYISSSMFKTICENCLLFFFILSIYFTYEFICTFKNSYLIAGTVCILFLFFIHVRSLGVIACYTVFLCIFCFYEKLPKYKVCIPILILLFGGCLLILVVKADIVSYKQSVLTSGEIANTVTEHYFSDRVYWMIKESGGYVWCFICKCFYSCLATAGLLIFWCRNRFYEIKKVIKNGVRLTNKECVFLLISCMFLVTILEMTVVGMGGTIYFMFYGRYYEFILPLIFAIELLPEEMAQISKRRVNLPFWTICLLILTKRIIIWTSQYYGNTMLKKDTNRLSALSLIIGDGKENNIVILEMGVLLFLCMIIYILCSKRKYVLFYLFSLLMMFSFSNVNMSEVKRIHETGRLDYELVQYIQENNIKKIYIIDDGSYKYDGFYSRIAMLVYDIDVEVINMRDDELTETVINTLDDNSYYLTYVTSERIQNMTNDPIIAHGNSVDLYYKK